MHKEIPDVKSTFEKQLAYQQKIGKQPMKKRKAQLRALKKAIQETYRQELFEALKADYNKPVTESELTETYPVVGEIKHALSNLRKWMDKHPVNTPIGLMGSSSYIQYQAKGVCLIIAPWNFPVNLTLGPLVSALAAGNSVIIKPSELSPHTSAVVEKIIKNLYPEEEVAVFQGGVPVSTALLELPFNHIFFTGSTAVGKIVMQAAAKNLTSVTLELGGKSPTIIDETASVKQLVPMLSWAKFLNNGQICIAPDYVFVHESKAAALVEALEEQIEKSYTANPETSDSYGRIINSRHFDRINEYLEEAKKQNAKITGGNPNPESNFIPPTLVENISDDSKLLKEEIFGPVLPIKTYKNLEEVVTYIQKRDKPLALYIFSKSKKNIRYLMENTKAGGTAINAGVLHFNNHHLPFGGDNASGIGKSHGFFGFKAFSNERGVLHQHLPSAIQLMFPPYTSFKEKLAKLTAKWF
ncbi:MAG: aldehyde dehydrogenase family protein [Flavobacteriaceae bacterium]|nr:aldehyde dehydrogenase family protein [Flavobacteriaceae bacterium]